jgi:hypothetical protein
MNHDIIQKQFRSANDPMHPTLCFKPVVVQCQFCPALEAHSYSENIPKGVDPCSGSVPIIGSFIFVDPILLIGLFVMSNNNIRNALELNTSNYFVSFFVLIGNKFFAIGVPERRVQNNPKWHVPFAVAGQIHFEYDCRDIVTVDDGPVVTSHVRVKIIFVFFVVYPAVALRRAQFAEKIHEVAVSDLLAFPAPGVAVPGLHEGVGDLVEAGYWVVRVEIKFLELLRYDQSEHVQHYEGGQQNVELEVERAGHVFGIVVPIGLNFDIFLHEFVPVFTSRTPKEY